MLSPFCLISQNITSISPNQGTQGSIVPLTISGNNISFSGWSCWSNTGNLSDFRFSQWSGTNMLYGMSTSAGFNILNGSLAIPAFQPTGVYNLEVFDCSSANWILFPNSFQINMAVSTSWDCVNNACVDPGTGNGTYNTLSACQTVCSVSSSWDCVNNACVDPGTGNGTYNTLSACQTACSVSSSWDCVNNACIDPGTGNGTYNTLSACQTACSVSSSWDCNPSTGLCFDPGTGNGIYTSLSVCQSSCFQTSVFLENIENFTIYPNPTQNSIIIQFTSVISQNLEVRIISALGEIVYIDNIKNYTGRYSNSISIGQYSKGIYLLRFKTDNGIINKKVLLQ
jgi:hypothetical protein